MKFIPYIILVSLLLSACASSTTQSNSAATDNTTAAATANDAAVVESDSIQDILRNSSGDDVRIFQIGDTMTIVLSADELFDMATPTIKSSADPIMNRIYNLLQSYRTQPIVVAAYSDNIGTAAEQLRLSQQRAESIVTYLWAQGIPFQKVTAVGYGSADPVASNSYGLGAAYNRRVVITVNTNS